MEEESSELPSFEKQEENSNSIQNSSYEVGTEKGGDEDYDSEDDY